MGQTSMSLQDLRERPAVGRLSRVGRLGGGRYPRERTCWLFAAAVILLSSGSLTRAADLALPPQTAGQAVTFPAACDPKAENPKAVAAPSSEPEPEPEDDEVNPSRPTFTNSPDLGPKGRVEVNIGAASDPDAVALPILLKYRIANDFETRIGFDGPTAPYHGADRSVDWNGGQLWLQWRPSRWQGLVHWGLWAAASGPLTEAPKAATWEGQLGLALAIELGTVRLDANLFRGSAFETAAPATTGASVVAAVSLRERWSVFGEVSDTWSREGPESKTDPRGLMGVAYSLSPGVIIDGAFELSLRSAREDHRFHAGISFLLPSQHNSRAKSPLKPESKKTE